MQYSKIFSALAIFVAAVAAAPACAPAAPGAPGVPGLPGLPGHPAPGAPGGPGHPNTGSDGVPTAPPSGACASNSQYSTAYCCTDDFSCTALVAVVGGVIPVCPSINDLVTSVKCCTNQQTVNQNSGSQSGLVNVAPIAIPINACAA